jgi:lipopolysaccharide export system protein LptA
VYDVKAGKITLTENPELKSGEDSLKGEVIMFWTDSERVSVQRSGKLQIRSKSNED